MAEEERGLPAAGAAGPLLLEEMRDMVKCQTSTECVNKSYIQSMFASK